MMFKIIIIFYYNILIMSRNVSDGDFYIQNRKMKESSMKKDLDKVSEGFEVYSTWTTKEK
jgi:hypothetical protein